MRLFIAINFGSETIRGFAVLRDGLRSRSRRGNFSLAENLHLTLVFLGECDKKTEYGGLDLTVKSRRHNQKQSTAVKAAMDEVRLRIQSAKPPL